MYHCLHCSICFVYLGQIWLPIGLKLSLSHDLATRRQWAKVPVLLWFNKYSSFVSPCYYLNWSGGAGLFPYIIGTEKATIAVERPYEVPFSDTKKAYLQLRRAHFEGRIGTYILFKQNIRVVNKGQTYITRKASLLQTLFTEIPMSMEFTYIG